MNKQKSSRPYPIPTLKHLRDSKKLWLNPSYQRESVWITSQKQLLIDSILRDIDIPKLYFREVNNPPYEMEVVDGQQRLRTIFEFLDDGFRLSLQSDNVDGKPLKGLLFSGLHTETQMKLQSAYLDVVVMNQGYTDDDIEEIFLRLQNGTPLNAAEKRRAISGGMRDLVADHSKSKAFTLCAYSDKRYAFEDSIAKILHLQLYGSITDIKPGSIIKTYENNKEITDQHKDIKKLKSALLFLSSAFKGKQSPKFKKYSMVTVTYLVIELLDKYDLSKHGGDFAESYLSFEAARVENEEKLEDKQEPALAAYTDAARSDSIPDLRYRHEFLRDYVVSSIPSMVLKDGNRQFSEEQRMAIYRLGNGKCVKCNDHCEEADFHADHIIPHSKGGKTCVSNGQVLCSKHNLSKGDKLI